MIKKNIEELNDKIKKLYPTDTNRFLHQIEKIHSFQVHIL